VDKDIKSIKGPNIALKYNLVTVGQESFHGNFEQNNKGCSAT